MTSSNALRECDAAFEARPATQYASSPHDYYETVDAIMDTLQLIAMGSLRRANG